MIIQKERFKNLGMAILIIVLFFVWPYFSNSIIGLFNFSETSQLYLKFFSSFVFMFLLIALYYDDLRTDLLKYKKNLKNYLKTGFSALIVGVIVMVVLNFILYVVLFPNLEMTSDLTLTAGFKKNAFLYFLMTFIYYPVTEELVFKKTLKNIIPGKWTFILVSAFINVFFTIAFSATNILNYLGILPLLALNASFSYAYYKTNNATVGISMRMLYNLIPTIIFFLG